MGRDIRKNILVIDDDELFCDVVAQHLASSEIEVMTAASASEGRDIFTRKQMDVILLDQQLPDASGKELCPDILAENDQTKIIFVTGYPSFDNAVEAIKSGAYDYLSKPIELDELDLAVSKALRTLDLERLERVQTYINNKKREEAVLVGESPPMKQVREMIEIAAANESSILITGETGSGKTLAARSIHFGGPLKKGPYISINCAALPENLIEAELFGFEKGAFTGASQAKRGIFEMAEGGSLALEEIGELPVHLQSKLLGVLDEKKIRRLGGDSERPVNVRVLATTNVDLEEAVREKRFRQDLFFRLSVLRIHMPPLRERPEDLPELCRSLMGKMAPAAGLELTEAEIALLAEYSWPGNVRELNNVLERSILLRKGNRLTPSTLIRKEPGPASAPRQPGQGAIRTLAEYEREHIIQALEIFSGNHTRTAKALGVSRSTLMRKMKNFGLK